MTYFNIVSCTCISPAFPASRTRQGANAIGHRVQLDLFIPAHKLQFGSFAFPTTIFYYFSLCRGNAAVLLQKSSAQPMSAANDFPPHNDGCNEFLPQEVSGHLDAIIVSLLFSTGASSAEEGPGARPSNTRQRRRLLSSLSRSGRFSVTSSN